MSDLTAKFAGLQAQLDAQATAAALLVDDVESSLTALFNLLDTINLNNAANTRYLLAAIGANSPCAPCPTPSLTVPPLDPTDQPLGSDKCKRTHAFIHALQEVMVVLDTMSAFAIPFSPSLISDAISQVITALANEDETPLPSFPESVQIVGDGINYIAGNLLVGDTLTELFSGIALDLVPAIYAEESAEGGKAAYSVIINASSIPGYAKPLMIDAAYNALWSYYFDPLTEPNLAGYSGTDCAAGLCDIVDSIAVTADDAAFPALTNRQMLYLPDLGSRANTFLSTVFSEDIVAGVDLSGWTITLTSGAGARVVWNALDVHQQFLVIDTPFEIPASPGLLFVDDVTAGLTLSGAFTVEWCAPEE